MKSHPSNPEPNDISRQSSKEMDNEVISYPFGDIENYELCYRIGRGKYSTVFSGLTNTGQQCVLKVLKPVRASKINREIRILEKLKESPNICNLLDVVKDQESQMVTLVLDWTNDDFRNIYQTLEMNEIAYYMYKVLQALDFAHSRGIMHRDIKPQNIMIDHSTKKVSLIDWGLADFYVPGTAYQVRVATRNYKAPELLFGYTQYTPTVDIWGLGCTFAAMLTKKSPLFRGRDNSELILRIADFIGSEEIENYLQKYKITISSHDITSRISGHKRRAHEFLKKDDTKNFITPEAEDLLMKMLTVDHQERISAKDAMMHPFFDCVRDMFK
ncbi:CMGC family protein kinase [Trichomonas vaginalis G3]|uniref:non-specific serine/threonine protein kinase n=1 Tax=Trichomonas vaginalis (strain ATCC PRA-98 / G3) TaxID=412133 RepID=A2E0I8_TRIV3|nr:STKc CK2 alpha domain-containing protein [Trichomonas vaginalis G3]EAY13868.1 CMGC family protein kinase [Trichomonas vaginalis G3]KAI5520430.1 STKc CK2 alpha domain-containing protein [Trichomonas vaginalis G3]|eukprot:XP_001326091.1 CMGC family protein kinase [Trichomonas vaginalis G3]